MPTIGESILVSVVSGTVSSVLTVWLSLNRFRREKWWERKAAAYERVIEALYHHKAYASAWLHSHEGGELPPDRRSELEQRSEVAYHEIDKAINVGAFIFNEEAHKRLKRYRLAVPGTSNMDADEDLHAYVEHDLQATASCLADLIEIAKKDLQTRHRFLPF